MSWATLVESRPSLSSRCAHSPSGGLACGCGGGMDGASGLALGASPQNMLTSSPRTRASESRARLSLGLGRGGRACGCACDGALDDGAIGSTCGEEPR